jgi:saccharopepsin
VVLWITIQNSPVDIVVRKMVLSRSLSFLLLPALAFLSLSARASPHLRTAFESKTAALKLAVSVNSNGIKNIAAADRARSQALQGRDGSSINVNNSQTIYTADIGVGTPPTYCKLLVLHSSIIFFIDHISHADTLALDTGSSNTWIGASKSYKKTETSYDTGNSFVSIPGPYALSVMATASSHLHTEQPMIQ